MINPILIIAAVAFVMCAAAVALINKPRMPLIAGSFIIVLIFFLFTTFMLDNSIADFGKSDALNDFIRFVVINDSPSYDDLAAVFKTFMYIDMGLFGCSLVSMFVEAMFILRKNSDV